VEGGGIRAIAVFARSLRAWREPFTTSVPRRVALASVKLGLVVEQFAESLDALAIAFFAVEERLHGSVEFLSCFAQTFPGDGEHRLCESHVILWDYKFLEADPSIQFLVLSPPEWALPDPASLADWHRTVLLTNPTTDNEVRYHRLAAWLASHKTRLPKELEGKIPSQGRIYRTGRDDEGIAPVELFKLIGLTLRGKLGDPFNP